MTRASYPDAVDEGLSIRDTCLEAFQPLLRARMGAGPRRGL